MSLVFFVQMRCPEIFTEWDINFLLGLLLFACALGRLNPLLDRAIDFGDGDRRGSEIGVRFLALDHLGLENLWVSGCNRRRGIRCRGSVGFDGFGLYGTDVEFAEHRIADMQGGGGAVFLEDLAINGEK